MANHTLEIARREGTHFRSVRLSLENDGAVTMEAQDIGPNGSKIWGDDEVDEYEFWVRVKPTSLSKLAFELVREKFTGQLDAVDAFRDWCNTHGVEYEFDSWV